jgi:hypothetical protein
VTDAISLLLELTEQNRQGFHLLLHAINTSTDRTFVPNPEITCLRFAPIENPNPLEWYTHLMVSGESGGTVISPGQPCTYSFRVRPCSIEPTRTQNENDWDYERWCIRLIQGEYRVWAEWKVNEGYFHPDSHLRIGDMRKMATENDASLWTGTIRSNILNLYYAEQ